MEAFLESLSPIWTPHEGQRQFLMATARTKILACGRRWGKTQACAVQILKVLSEKVPAQILIVAPTLDQARIPFERVAEMATKLFGKLVKVKNSPFPFLSFDAHELVARSGHHPRSLRGHEATHVLVDEAAFVDDGLVHDTLMPMLATTRGHLWEASTPNGFNHFYRMFELARSATAEMWARTAPSAENPYVAPEFLAAQREMVSERTFAVEYEAQFLECEGAVFGSVQLDACLFVDSAPPEGAARLATLSQGKGIMDPLVHVSIGIDWGRKRDFTVLIAVCGSFEDAVVLEIKRLHGVGFVEQVEILKPILDRYPHAEIAYDGTGIGDPITDILRIHVQGRACRSVVFEQENRRQMVDRLISHVERGALRFRPDPVLLSEMRSFKWHKGRADGVGEHDDTVFALALALIALPREYGVQQVSSKRR